MALVTAWDAVPKDLVSLQSGLGRLPTQPPIVQLDHDEIRERAVDDPSLRRRAEEMRVAKGRVARSFPDRSRHGSFSARPLGHLHPDIVAPSDRGLRELASRFGLRRVTVFGSAVRDDLRRDSDVDVLVEHRPGAERTLVSDTSLRAALEDLVDRDVDLIDVSTLSRAVRERAEREGVTLYG